MPTINLTEDECDLIKVALTARIDHWSLSDTEVSKGIQTMLREARTKIEASLDAYLAGKN